MIGIQLVSHGQFGQGLLDSLRMIVGPVEEIGYSQLDEGVDVEDYQQAMLNQSRELDTGKGVLVFADMYGATPYITAQHNSRKFAKEMYQVIAGVNLPLVIEAVLSREAATLEELVAQLGESANESIVLPEK